MSDLLGGVLLALYFPRVLMALAALALAGMAWRHATPASPWRFSARDLATLLHLTLIAAAFAVGAWMEFAA